MDFMSHSEEIGSISTEFDHMTIKNEPMLFSSDLKFAFDNGGPITRAFLQAIPTSIRLDPTVIIDTRVHMLMKDWYPCIPGWHHDDVSRNTPDGQPNYREPAYRTEHIVCLVNGDVAPTEFLEGPVVLNDPEDRVGDDAIYKMWDYEIEAQRKEVHPFKTFSVKDRTLYKFNDRTFHRGTAAVSRGWRWFGRLSTGRAPKHAPELRRQVNVYMSAVNAGW